MASRRVPERFLVAFSLASENRELVRSVAAEVERRLGESTVFYDEWFEYYLAGPDADLKLQRIYGQQCELAVICISGGYGSRPWTEVEHRVVRARYMQAAQSELDRARVLAVRVGDGDVEGIWLNDIVPDLRGRDVDAAAQLIIERLSLVWQPASDREDRTLEWPNQPPPSHSPTVADAEVSGLPSDEELGRQIEMHRQQRIVEGLRRTEARQPLAGQYPIFVPDHLFGRDEELNKLSALLATPETRVATVVGPRGVGKTALVCTALISIEKGHWPHDPDWAEMPSGIVCVSARTDEARLERVVVLVATLLGGDAERALLSDWQASTGLEDRIGRLLDALPRGLSVIFLDNVEDVLDDKGRFNDESLQAFFEAALSRGRDSMRLVITTDRPLAFDPQFMQLDQQVKLYEGLPDADCVAMLRSLDPNGDLFRGVSDEQLVEIARHLHGVPRALQLVAGILAGDPLANIDSVVSTFYGTEDTMSELVAEAHKRLDGSSRRVLEALAVFRRPIEPVAIQYLLQPFGIDVVPVVRELARTHVLMFDRQYGLASLHPMNQEFAYRHLPIEGEYSRKSLERRAADYYSQLRTPREYWRSVLDLDAHRLEFEHRLRAEDYDGAAEVLSLMDVNFMVWGGHPQMVQDMHSQVRGRITNLSLRMLNAYGFAHSFILLGPLPRALELLQESASLADDLGDDLTKRESIGWTGEVHRRLGQLPEAIEELSHAVDMYGDAGGNHGANVFGRLEDFRAFLLGLSLAYSAHGSFDRAVETGERLLRLAGGEGTPEEGQAHDALALAYLVASRLDEALEHARRALAIYPQEIVKDRALDSAGYVLNLQGVILARLGRMEEALSSLEKGRKTGSALENPRLEAFCLFNLARTLEQKGDRALALSHAESCAAILDRLGAPEAAAAHSLAAAVRAGDAGATREEALALLTCAEASTLNPDLLFPGDLLRRVMNAATDNRSAGSAEWSELFHRASTLANTIAPRGGTIGA